jgi:hypothetical protein
MVIFLDLLLDLDLDDNLFYLVRVWIIQANSLLKGNSIGEWHKQPSSCFYECLTS